MVRLDVGRTVLCPQRCFRGDASPAPMRLHSGNAMYEVDERCWAECSGIQLDGAMRFVRVWGDSAPARSAVLAGSSHMHGSGGTVYSAHADGCVRAFGPGDAAVRTLWRSERGERPISVIFAAGGFVAGLRLVDDGSLHELLVLSADTGRALAATRFEKTSGGCRRTMHNDRPLALWPSPCGGFAAFCSTGDGIATLTSQGSDRKHATFGTRVAGVHGDELCTHSRDAIWLSKLSLLHDGTVRLRHDILWLEGGIETCAFSDRGHIAVLLSDTRSVLLLRRMAKGGYRMVTLHGHQCLPEGALFVGGSLVTACADACFRWPLSLSGSLLREQGVRADLYTRMLLLAFRRTCPDPVPQEVIEAIVVDAVDEMVQFAPHHVL